MESGKGLSVSSREDKGTGHLSYGWRRADCLGEGGGPTRVPPPRFATTRGWAWGSFGFGPRLCVLDADKNRVQ